MAARWVFDSVQQLDSVDPTISYHGISLLLKSHEILESSLRGYRSPEIVAAATRSQYLAAVFAERLTSMGMPREQVEERRDSARELVATLDLLRQAAIDSGDFAPAAAEACPRWQRHIIEQTEA